MLRRGVRVELTLCVVIAIGNWHGGRHGFMNRGWWLGVDSLLGVRLGDLFMQLLGQLLMLLGLLFCRLGGRLLLGLGFG